MPPPTSSRRKRQRQRRRPVLPSHTRPPTIQAKSGAHLSSKATRNLIRSHHRLTKLRAQVSSQQQQQQQQQRGRNNDEEIQEIDAKIEANGGLRSYQQASKLGQSLERGGDSSRMLMDWITPGLIQQQHFTTARRRLRVLEIGALSTRNACSTSPLVSCTRIDLNSQEPGILQQDFMERPLPKDDSERFHLISLSLVLNYVPTALGRGEMLKRCVSFLLPSPPSSSLSAPASAAANRFPSSLFLVLPAACVDNSRYLTDTRLSEIMAHLGFRLVRNKRTAKLIFQLWELDHRPGPHHSTTGRYAKKEMLNPGKVRNNFAIILCSGDDRG